MFILWICTALLCLWIIKPDIIVSFLIIVSYLNKLIRICFFFIFSEIFAFVLVDCHQIVLQRIMFIFILLAILATLIAHFFLVHILYTISHFLAFVALRCLIFIVALIINLSLPHNFSNICWIMSIQYIFIQLFKFFLFKCFQLIQFLSW